MSELTLWLAIFIVGSLEEIYVAGNAKDEYLTADYVAVGVQSAILTVLIFIAILIVVAIKRISR